MPPRMHTGRREGRPGRPGRVKCKGSHQRSGLVVILSRAQEQSDGRYLLSAFQSCDRTHRHTNTIAVTTSHTHDKVLSQHPQIRLHVTFPIRGFLKRLNPECGDIPAWGAERRLIFLCMGSECWLAGGSATLIPDFHKIRGRAVSTAAAANYRCDDARACLCTRSHMHPATHTPVQKQISPGWSHQSDVNPPSLPPPSSSSSLLVSSHLRQEGTCQRMLSSPASQSSQRRRQSENKWTQREPIMILISLSKEAPATDGS